ncbi:M20 family metallo-hydrolase [Phycisphaera mikurensis]|uniref:N-carbamoyl-L-amino acid hydrolase n=1 Tax=Phycisphaera mikurensis (strain NBRC 102666 / KCTC 22515 / FYK2301M01) TaxID=1142394 RepID=I0IIY3_PHYMF|nr:M20 family metallo-hydrolase [Phycisphaera mikurensis]MBB6443068.1 N-carbamoyl-L-amino-acid hydrolase [Phycisphaera mikurensis]BAM05221.1 N-carbamoyl-L-amino acid hydrolase [Phycisphaera mikurensis NBRC 102666]
MNATLPEIAVDAARVVAELKKLATFSAEAEVPAGLPEPTTAVSRVVFTEPDLAMRAWFTGLCEEAGLTVRVDPMGNTFARWGDPAASGAVGTGSHNDAIPHSGMYDGTVGVLGGLEAIRALQRAGFVPVRPIELVMFTSEEPTRFGLGCSGSRVMTGAMEAAEVAALTDPEGRSFDDVRRAAGFSGDLADARLAPDHFHAFVELHTEQGPLLEREGLDIGIVTAIAAPLAAEFEVLGAGGHAGAVLMPDRHDALCAAAEMVLAIEAAAKSSGAVDTVTTVGEFTPHPGHGNSIANRVRFTLDLRDTDGDRRDAAWAKIRDGIDAICARRGVTATHRVLNADPPAACYPLVVDAVADAAAGLTTKRTISRAYHDSLFMARVCPTGMIFIPCRGGVSHRPDEFASESAIGHGVLVLARTLARLATST